eukprot:scaffold2121_cov62-Phaeocystis_antarctica.AAC.1
MAALLVGALSGAPPFVPPPTAHGPAAAFFSPPNGHDGQWQHRVRRSSSSSSSRVRRSTRGSRSRGARRGSLSGATHSTSSAPGSTPWPPSMRGWGAGGRDAKKVGAQSAWTRSACLKVQLNDVWMAFGRTALRAACHARLCTGDISRTGQAMQLHGSGQG